MSSDNHAVVNGVREFYAHASIAALSEMGRTWPEFENLTREQALAWTRAYGAAVTLSAETAAAFMAMGE